MAKRKTKMVDGENHYLKKDGSLGAPTNLGGRKKKGGVDHDADRGESRAEKDGATLTPDNGRKPRIHRGAGRALDLPAAILEDIESRGCVYRWVTDEGHRVQMFLDDWWDIYKDSNGKQIRTLAGTGKNGQGVDFVLMIQRKEYAAETAALQKKKNAGNLDSQQVLSGGPVPEYVPDGQNAPIERVGG